MPLSSQTNSTGSRVPVWSNQPAVLKAAWATAWFTDASPNEQTTMASSAHCRAVPRGRRGGRSMA
jgi:hypothetical protein